MATSSTNGPNGHGRALPGSPAPSGDDTHSPPSARSMCRRPLTGEDRSIYTPSHDVEVWGTGVRVTLSDGETVHEFPNWNIDREERQSTGSYSYALSGTGELHVIETFYAPGSLEAELNNGKPKRTVVQTYSGHAWRNATGPVTDVTKIPVQ